jgi:hypothetical protein
MHAFGSWRDGWLGNRITVVTSQRLILFCALGFAFWATDSLAQQSLDTTTQQCVASYERVQHLRREGKLIASLTESSKCLHKDCPSALQADCAEWYKETERSIPTVVLAARDEAGREFTRARILLDRTLIADAITGRSISVDPGPIRSRSALRTACARRRGF